MVKGIQTCISKFFSVNCITTGSSKTCEASTGITITILIVRTTETVVGIDVLLVSAVLVDVIVVEVVVVGVVVVGVVVEAVGVAVVVVGVMVVVV